MTFELSSGELFSERGVVRGRACTFWRSDGVTTSMLALRGRWSRVDYVEEAKKVRENEIKSRVSAKQKGPKTGVMVENHEPKSSNIRLDWA